MNHLIFSSDYQESFPVCILTHDLREKDLRKAYLDPVELDEASVLALSLFRKPGAKKTPAKEMQEYIINELAPVLNENQVQYVICTDSDYFKQLVKVAKTDTYLGYVMDSPFGSWKVVYAPSHKTIFYDPVGTKEKILTALRAVQAHAEGTYQDPGQGVLKDVSYPETYFEIQSALAQLLARDCDLAIDIEAFSLKHYNAGIGSIAFAWDEHSGVAFAVDYKELPEPSEGAYGTNERNEPVRALLKDFFLKFKRKAVYHNIAYDATVLIYQLFMDHILDLDGLLHGMDVMLSNWDCTKLITYLATNSCAGNELSLKTQAQEHAGNYAEEEIKDIRRIPKQQLLQYNLVDSCSTWFTYNKRHPEMVADDQEDVYVKVFKPALVDIVQMQLTGMPVNINRVAEVKVLLQADNDDALKRINESPVIQQYCYQRKEEWVYFKNTTLKKKRVTLADAEVEWLKPKSDLPWNPNSNQQVAYVLYDLLGLPVIELTESGQPSTSGDTLKNLRNHSNDPQTIALLDAFLDYTAVNKILTSFIPALESAQQGEDGWHYLFGNFNLGGTVSGRLSSSNPNLQNLPANSKYAKLIKSCFEAPPGWVFVGLDFALMKWRRTAAMQ